MLPFICSTKFIYAVPSITSNYLKWFVANFLTPHCNCRMHVTQYSVALLCDRSEFRIGYPQVASHIAAESVFAKRKTNSGRMTRTSF